MPGLAQEDIVGAVGGETLRILTRTVSGPGEQGERNKLVSGDHRCCHVELVSKVRKDKGHDGKQKQGPSYQLMEGPPKSFSAHDDLKSSLLKTELSSLF